MSEELSIRTKLYSGNLGPNPLVNRTRNRWSRKAPISFWALRAQPLRAGYRER
jgi:hypothetical protein